MRLISLVYIYVIVLTACSYEPSHLNIPIDTHLSHQLIDNHLAINVDNSGHIDSRGLAEFAKKIENVRILALGEQTHGAGNVFTLKTDLIKYLHKHHGFDLFILESGMYDVREIVQQAKNGQSIKALAPGNIFYMYANSKEVTPLFDYVNEQLNTDNPLMMVGFDSQHTGGISLTGLVTDLTKAQQTIDKAWVNSSQWLVFSSQIQQVLDGSRERLSSEQEKLFFTQLDKLASNFEQHENGFWFRISKGLAAQAKRQWQLGDNRSQQMGENIKWWAEQYPDKKIIVWAHTWHLTKEGNNQINAGKVVSDAFGDAYYMVHFSGEKGQYLSYIDLTNEEVAKPKHNSVEQLFSQTKSSPISYIENKGLSFQGGEMHVFSNDYKEILAASEWATYWDGMFILKKITPATYQQ
ncbi:erythromycin esterase family protein [Colwellia sp. 75C3]|uniref:erythromycin esterase family protein n=1 Tax=Colwellia sp. 75C3 TaxID=888425 RepID=UPI0012FE9079|nr:erythromycin esterase family protein [Colwellia sp. 75C3]